MRIHYAISLLLIVLTASCEHDSYDTGEGGNSRLHADYVTVKVHNDYVQNIVTDDDKALEFSKGMTYDVQPVDTTLRWLLYYNEGSPIEIVGRNTMSLLKPQDRIFVNPLKIDPVKVISVWLSPNKKYLNMRLGLMVGNTETEKNKHRVGLVRNGIEDNTVYYTLYHDQADIPQYYTQEYYFTVEAPEQKEIDLTINAYNGVYHKTFTVRE